MPHRAAMRPCRLCRNGSSGTFYIEEISPQPPFGDRVEAVLTEDLDFEVQTEADGNWIVLESFTALAPAEAVFALLQVGAEKVRLVAIHSECAEPLVVVRNFP